MRTGISFSSWWTMLCNIQLPVSAGVPKERGLLAEIKKVTYVHTLFEFSQKIVPALNIFSMQKSYVTNGSLVKCRTEEKNQKPDAIKKKSKKLDKARMSVFGIKFQRRTTLLTLMS